MSRNVRHGARDVEEVLEELAGDILVDVVFTRQFQRDAHKAESVHRHPGSAVGLVYMSPGRQWLRAVKDADIVQAQKTTLKDVSSLSIKPVDPPGEVEHQLMEDPLQEGAIAFAAVAQLFQTIDAPSRNRIAREDLHRRSSTRRPGAARWDACTTRGPSRTS